MVILLSSTYLQYTIFIRKFRFLRIPSVIVAQGAVHQHYRESRTGFLICHVVTVDLDRLDALRQGPFRRSDSRRSEQESRNQRSTNCWPGQDLDSWDVAH